MFCDYLQKVIDLALAENKLCEDILSEKVLYCSVW